MLATDLSLRRGQRRWYDSWSRYLALVTVAVTLGTATAVFFTVGKELGGVGELVTAAIGLLGLVVSLQLETLFRTSERTQAREQYGLLLQMTEDYPELLPLVAGLTAATVTTLKTTGVEQFKAEALKFLVHAEVRLNELAQGRFRTVDGDSTLILDRFDKAAKSIEATTDDGDTRWWSQDNGARFFELNRKLIAAGVKIERVWILSEPPTEETREVLRKHAEIGVKLFVLRADQIDLDRRLLINMTVMDGEFLHEDLPNKQGKAVEYLYSENPADLARARSRFAQLKASAARYTGAESLDALFSEAGSPQPSMTSHSGLKELRARCLAATSWHKRRARKTPSGLP